MSENIPPPRAAQGLRTPFWSAKITRLETSGSHALHAYQGLCPWSPSADRLLYAVIDEVPDIARMIVRDLRNGTEFVAGESSHCDFHTGSYQQWVLYGDGIVFRNRENGIIGSTVAPAPGSSLQPVFYPGLRIRTTARRGLRGYGQLKENDLDGAARVDFSTGRIERFFTVTEAALHLPKNLREDCPFSISHFVPNAAETLAFFKLSKPEPHRKIPGHMDDWGAFFVYDLQNRTFRCFGQRVSGHPQWMPDDRRIVNIMQPLDGSDNRHLVAQDALTGDVDRLVDFPIEGAGHPVFSPDGRYLATDAYTADHRQCPVYVIDLATGQMAEIARFNHITKITDTYQPHTLFRSNLHPVWSPDGSRLLVNANENGTRLGLFLLENFLTENP